MTAKLAAPLPIPALAPADNSKEDRFVVEFTVGEEVEVSEVEEVEEIVEVDDQVVEADGDESDIVN
jgi:chemotaxis signal transduction protein